MRKAPIVRSPSESQYRDKVVDLGTRNANFTVNVADGVVHKVTISGSAVVVDFTGWIPETSVTIILAITNGAGISEFTNVKFPGGIKPTLSSGLDRMVFVSDDGGATVLGFLAGADIK